MGIADVGPLSPAAAPRPTTTTTATSTSRSTSSAARSSCSRTGRADWLEVELDGFAPGTRVTVTLPDGRELVREAQAGSSYLSSEDPARALRPRRRRTAVDALVVRWPDGAETTARRRRREPDPASWSRPRRAAPAGADRRQALALAVGAHRPARGLLATYDRRVAPTSTGGRWPACGTRRCSTRIRRDAPAPTVHARNLFHTSAAMWDAWAAYDPDADGYFVDEKHEADDVQAAREAAISYAAYRVLLYRYSNAAGLQETFDELASTMESLCYRIDYVSDRGRLAGGARQPDRRGRHRARPRRRLARGAAVRRHRLQAGERAARRRRARRRTCSTRTGGSRSRSRSSSRRTACRSPATSSASSDRTGATWPPSRCPTSAEGLPIDPGPPPHLGDRRPTRRSSRRRSR